MERYKLLNNATGWAMFAIAAFTYISTIEPTASLWDCGEFIVSADKLEVGHPPGAPLFMMVGRLFAMLAPSPDQVAKTINIFSALCSAFTILFLFWSITRLARRFVNRRPEEYTLADIVTVLGSGAVGALAYTFSDTFWFSAVEGEVYAASSLLTAIVFWLALKWEEQADSPYANRWLVLSAYVMGLSIGVHLLNLLVVPAIVFVYYFRKYPISRGGLIKTSCLAVIILASLLWGIIPLVPKIGSWFELMFVNGFGLPVNSGLVFYVFLLAAVLAFAVYYTHKKGKVLLNTVMLCLTVCILGYGSYAMIVIRSSADLPMDQNSPDNIFSLISYLNRDQYGSRPLVTGPYFTNHNGKSEIKFSYVRNGNKYTKDELKHTIKYEQTTLFPRMYSDDKRHAEVYKQYLNGKPTPSFADNVAFFIDYQINFMYWRYFMWNFVGRQNDMQAEKGDYTRGNWLSGIKFIDEARLGPQDNQPWYMTDNKGRNTYFFLPLLLGLLGLIFQLRKDKQGFILIALLFFFTGIAIVMYLNQSPDEPRERDYTYAGSFYAFAVWIGFGVAALGRFISKYLPSTVTAAAAVAIAMPVPVLMAAQNLDDHDRSGRYICADFGYNYLNSCDKNAIIYTYGDNDTFALWYNQETEGVRTDVKVANTMYLSADWYYIQMMRRTYDAPPVAATATPEKLVGSIRNYTPLYERIKSPVDLRRGLEFFMSDREEDKVNLSGLGNMKVNYSPAREYFIPIDKDEVLEKGMVKPEDSAAIPSRIVFTIDNMLYKNTLAMLDFAGNNFLKRPVYYGMGGETKTNMGIENRLKQEGLAHKLVPEDVTISDKINIDKTYDLLMNVYKYRGIGDPDVYMDETARRQAYNYRIVFFALAETLMNKGDKERLRNLAEKIEENLPIMNLVNPVQTPYYRFTNPLIHMYFVSDLTDKGKELAEKLADEYVTEINYYFRLSKSKKTNQDYEIGWAYNGLADLKNIASQYGQNDLVENIESKINVIRSLR